MGKYIWVQVVDAEPQFAPEREDYCGPYQGGKEGYRVTYPDGHVAWSPKSGFEEVYRETSGMTFGLALEALKKGMCVCRKGWNGKGMWIVLQRPDEWSKMTIPYMYIEYPNGHPAYPNGSLVPWVPSQTDALAEDWEIFT